MVSPQTGTERHDRRPRSAARRVRTRQATHGQTDLRNTERRGYRDQVVLEITRTGVLAVPLETIPAAGEMRAYFAMFLDFRDGKIVRQSNYDCFEPR